MGLFKNVGIGSEALFKEWLDSLQETESGRDLRHIIKVNDDKSISIGRLVNYSRDNSINEIIPQWVKIKTISSLSVMNCFPYDFLTRAEKITNFNLWSSNIPEGFKIKAQLKYVKLNGFTAEDLTFLNQTEINKILLSSFNLKSLNGLPNVNKEIRIEGQRGDDKFTLKDVIDTGIDIDKKLSIIIS